MHLCILLDKFKLTIYDYQETVPEVSTKKNWSCKMFKIWVVLTVEK